MADTVTKFDIISALLTTGEYFYVTPGERVEGVDVSSIDIVPAGLPGFYVLIVHYGEAKQRNFFVSPGTVVLEGGNPQQEEIQQTPKIVIPTGVPSELLNA